MAHWLEGIALVLGMMYLVLRVGKAVRGLAELKNSQDAV